MTEKDSEWQSRGERFQQPVPGWTRWGNYVKTYLKQLGWTSDALCLCDSWDPFGVGKLNKTLIHNEESKPTPLPP